jgi:hypothetical protein
MAAVGHVVSLSTVALFILILPLVCYVFNSCLRPYLNRCRHYLLAICITGSYYEVFVPASDSSAAAQFAAAGPAARKLSHCLKDQAVFRPGFTSGRGGFKNWLHSIGMQSVHQHLAMGQNQRIAQRIAL